MFVLFKTNADKREFGLVETPHNFLMHYPEMRSSCFLILACALVTEVLFVK